VTALEPDADELEAVGSSSFSQFSREALSWLAVWACIQQPSPKRWKRAGRGKEQLGAEWIAEIVPSLFVCLCEESWGLVERRYRFGGKEKFEQREKPLFTTHIYVNRPDALTNHLSLLLVNPVSLGNGVVYFISLKMGGGSHLYTSITSHATLPRFMDMCELGLPSETPHSGKNIEISTVGLLKRLAENGKPRLDP
jgi:hypothetical protein